MTDKQIIETLKNIKKHCIGRNCDSCVFKASERTCLIVRIAKTMTNIPAKWDMEGIERLVNL